MRSRIAWGAGYLAATIIGAAAAGVIGVLTGGPGATASEVHTQQAASLERTIALAAGFNLVGWTGSEPIGAADAAAAIPGATAIFDFNAATQEFRSYRPGAPAILNTLAEIAPGSAVWVQVADATVWTQPSRTDAQAQSLQPGFNLVVWTGPSGTPVSEATGDLGSALMAVFRYDAATGSFVSYGPGRPAFLNTLATLGYGDGLYVQVSGAASWEQPGAPTAPTQEPRIPDCDASYPSVCIPPPPPYLSCDDVPYQRFTVLPPDPHRFDRDRDGIGCEG